MSIYDTLSGYDWYIVMNKDGKPMPYVPEGKAAQTEQELREKALRKSLRDLIMPPIPTLREVVNRREVEQSHAK